MGKHSKLIIKQVNNTYDSEKAIVNILRYIVTDKESAEKEQVRYWKAFGADSKNIEKVIQQYENVQELFGKTKKKRIRHIILSFPMEMDDANTAKLVAEAVADMIYKSFQVTYAVHEKERNLHVHLAINPVSYRTGKKWHMSKKEFKKWKEDVCEIVNTCVTENGYRECNL